MACRPYAIDSNDYEPLTRQEGRGIETALKGFRVHLMPNGEETGGNYVGLEETVILSIFR